MISFIAKLLVALNNNSRPGELSSGIAFGFCLSLIPGGNLLWVVIFIIAFLLKHHLGAMLLTMLLFRPFSGLMDMVFHNTGEMVLTAPSLQNLLTKMYNMPAIPWFHFNNTVVMGSFIWSLILWIPLFLIFRLLVVFYRKKIASRLAESKFVKAISKIPLVSKLNSAYRKFSFLT